MKHSKEEKHILKALENGKIQMSTPSKTEIESIKSAASNTFKKDRYYWLRCPYRSMNHTMREQC